MSGHWTDQFSFYCGVVKRDDMGLLLAGNDDLLEDRIPHTSILLWRYEDWGAHSLEWSAVSICCCTSPRDEIVVVGELGDVFVMSPEGNVEETSINIERDDKVGHLRVVQCIGGRAYAAGMDRQVYRRLGPGNWEALDNGLPPGGEDEIVGFEAIDGYSEDELYAVGRRGEIWRFDGQRWKQIDSPTNLILTGVTCAPDGYVYVCGQAGLILRGRGQAWDVIEHDSTEDYFWDVKWFNGKLFLVTLSLLYSYDGDDVELYIFEDELPLTFYRLSIADNVMWSIGAKDAMAFDGKTWTRID